MERQDADSLLEKGHKKMDEKKVREAIEVIKGYRRLDEYMNNTERLPYCDMAIEALEKQLLKKVDVWANGTQHCPVCDKDLTYTGFHICPECYQRLCYTK